MKKETIDKIYKWWFSLHTINVSNCESWPALAKAGREAG